MLAQEGAGAGGGLAAPLVAECCSNSLVFIQKWGQKYFGDVLVEVRHLNVPFLLLEGSDLPAP